MSKDLPLKRIINKKKKENHTACEKSLQKVFQEFHVYARKAIWNENFATHTHMIHI